MFNLSARPVTLLVVALAVVLTSIVATTCIVLPRLEDGTAAGRPSWLAPIPEIDFDAAALRPSAEEKAEIRGAIDALSDIDSPNFGLSSTLSGTQFAPIESSGQFQGGLIRIDHGLRTPDGLRRLVAFGPRAIPDLLEALDDDTPTQLVMKHPGPVGAMWYGRELPINPLHAREARVKESHASYFVEPVNESFFEHTISRHAITRGDVCFVILGQIFNRNYEACRYQPSSCQVINSPTADAELARIVREMWSSGDPARTLFDSLMTDFHTRGELLQCRAAQRLLFYFPDQTVNLIARRIDGLDVRKAAGESERRRRGDTNQIDVGRFLESVKRIDHKAITRSLVEVARRTDDPNIFDAALNHAVVDQISELVFRRLRERVSVATPGPDDNSAHHPHGDAYDALVQAARFFPDRSAELFRLHASLDTLNSPRATIYALRDAGSSPPWATDHLGSLLDDRRATNWDYGPDYDLHPLRVSDEAARVLNGLVEEIYFEAAGSHADVDRAIEKIKRFLDGDRSVDFERPRPLPADLPRLEAATVLDLDADLGRVYAFSDRETMFVRRGFREDSGWAYEIIAIDVATGAVRKRTRLDSWKGGVKILRTASGRRAYCYHGNTGGHIFVRDLLTGEVLRRIETPFHDWVEGDDALQIRNGTDVAVSGDESWIVAFTPDGALHSIDTRTGAHKVEWKYAEAVGKDFSGRQDITALRRTNRFLLEGDSHSDPVLRVWDQETRTMSEVKRVPYYAWRGGWGNVAWRAVNRQPEVWDLETRKQIKLPGGTWRAVDFELSRDGRTLFALEREGSVIVYRLPSTSAISVLVAPVSDPVEDDGWGSPFEMSLSSDDHLLFWQRESGRGDDATTTIAVFDVADLTED